MHFNRFAEVAKKSRNKWVDGKMVIDKQAKKKKQQPETSKSVGTPYNNKRMEQVLTITNR